MSYPSYLIHFNPNHDPKTGQFTYVKNSWAIRKGYQNKDGSISEKGKKALQARKEDQQAGAGLQKETNKLLKLSKKLRDDFGDDPDMYDELFEETAKDYGLNTKKFHEELEKRNKYQELLRNDKERYRLVKDGQEMYRRMRDLNPDFYKKGYIENRSTGTLASALIAAVYGMPTIATITAISAIPEKIEENKYKKVYEKSKK